MHFRNKKKYAQDVYINDSIESDNDGNALTLMDVMASDDNLLDEIDLRIKSEKLYRYISDLLDNREQQILVMRYGLFSTAPLTQREVSQKLHISRSYVSRIEKKALTPSSKAGIRPEPQVHKKPPESIRGLSSCMLIL